MFRDKKEIGDNPETSVGFGARQVKLVWGSNPDHGFGFRVTRNALHGRVCSFHSSFPIRRDRYHKEIHGARALSSHQRRSGRSFWQIRDRSAAHDGLGDPRSRHKSQNKRDHRRYRVGSQTERQALFQPGSHAFGGENVSSQTMLSVLPIGTSKKECRPSNICHSRYQPSAWYTAKSIICSAKFKGMMMASFKKVGSGLAGRWSFWLIRKTHTKFPRASKFLFFQVASTLQTALFFSPLSSDCSNINGIVKAAERIDCNCSSDSCACVKEKDDDIYRYIIACLRPDVACALRAANNVHVCSGRNWWCELSRYYFV